MELAKSGTLYHLRTGPRLEEDRIWKYCIQMLLAMEYIHSKKVIHRDIKTLNLMVDGNDDVKLGVALCSKILPAAHLFSASACRSTWSMLCRGLWHCKVTEYRYKHAPNFGGNTVLFVT